MISCPILKSIKDDEIYNILFITPTSEEHLLRASYTFKRSMLIRYQLYVGTAIA